MNTLQKTGIALGLAAALGASGCAVRKQAAPAAQPNKPVAAQPEKPAAVPQETKAAEPQFRPVVTGTAWIDDGITPAEANKLSLRVPKLDGKAIYVLDEKGNKTPVENYSHISFAKDSQDNYFLFVYDAKGLMQPPMLIGADGVAALLAKNKLPFATDVNGLSRLEKFVVLSLAGVEVDKQENKRFELGFDKNAKSTVITATETTVKDQNGQDTVAVNYTAVSTLKDKTLQKDLTLDDIKLMYKKVSAAADFENRTEMVLDEKTGIMVPKAAYEKAKMIAEMPDTGKLYTHTMGELESLCTDKRVSDADKRYVGRTLAEIKRQFTPEPKIGWNPAGYDMIVKGLENLKVAKENIPEAMKKLEYEVAFKHGGRSMVQVNVYYVDQGKKENVCTKKHSITSGSYFGGNAEDSLARALRAVGYTD